VFCIAFGAASHGCFGGPTSDWPDKNSGDEDDDKGPSPTDGPKTPPSGAADAGTGGRGPLDAGLSGSGRDSAIAEGADASGDGGQVDDAGAELDAAPRDAGAADDGALGGDASGPDAADVNSQRDH
jgi:hypothetical protein